MSEPTPPAISSITFDQPQYTKGQTINATVTYTAGTSGMTQAFTGTAADGLSGLTGEQSVQFVLIINDATTVSVSDQGNRVWTKISDTGAVAVFQAIA